MSSRILAVIGAGVADAELAEQARSVGQMLAERGCTVITGGLGGVMEAASRGAAEAGGLVIGVLPGSDPAAANRWVGIPVATGMGDARNTILANTAEAFVAVGGSHGTLSEIAFALKRGKRVVALGSWEVDPEIRRARSAAEAVELALEDTGERGSLP
jgi:uncharacterized protein (TIGR00725 family)